MHVLSWSRGETKNYVDVRSIRIVSQNIKFKIVNIDKDANGISLSYKALLVNPWDKVKDKIGKEVKIKINYITDKAIFGELVESKLSGILH